MGDFAVHRLRIGNWTTSAVRSIAVDKWSNKIAVGRDNGDIEICDAADKFYCQARVVGKNDFKLQAMVWSTDPNQPCRLFGISLRGFIFEVDLISLMVTNVKDTYGGTAWAIAASPRDSILAVGCEDGILRLFKYDNKYDTASVSGTGAAGQRLEYLKSLPSSGDRILSVAYHPRKDERKVFIGCSDGTIRCMDEVSGSVYYRMTGDILRASVSTLIWSLLVLPDSTIVSGDSRGQVQIWDGVAGVLMDTFRNHAADVICLTSSPDSQLVFAAGVDGKVACLQNLNTSTAASRTAVDGNWVYLHSQRAHSHDVLTLAVCYDTTARTAGKKTAKATAVTTAAAAQSAATKVAFHDGTVNTTTASAAVVSSSDNSNWLLLSGGIDAKICTYSVGGFVRSRPVWLGTIPANTVLSHSDGYEVVSVNNRDHVDLWTLKLRHSRTYSTTEPSSAKSTKTAKTAKTTTATSAISSSAGGATSASGGAAAELDAEVALAVRVEAAGNGYIHCSSVSPCGQILALSNAAGLRVYNIIRAGGGGGGESQNLQLERLKLPKSLPRADFAQSIVFYRTETESEQRLKFAVFWAVEGTLSICEIELTDTDTSTVQQQQGSGIVTVLHTIPHRQTVVSNVPSTAPLLEQRLNASVSRMSVSACGQFLAVVSSGTFLYLYNLISGSLHWKVPTGDHSISDALFTSFSSADAAGLGTTGTTTDKGSISQAKKPHSKKSSRSKVATQLPPSTAAFRPVSLMVMMSNNVFKLYDVKNLRQEAWTEQFASVAPPPYVQKLSTPICGVAIDGTEPHKMILYSQGFCVYVNLAASEISTVPQVGKGTAASKALHDSFGAASSRAAAAGKNNSKHNSKSVTAATSKKRKVQSVLEQQDGGNTTVDDRNYVVFNAYRNLLHVGLLPDNNLVVVENPWANMQKALPATLARKRYGT